MPNDGKPPVVDPAHPPITLIRNYYYEEWGGYYDDNWNFIEGQPPEQ